MRIDDVNRAPQTPVTEKTKAEPANAIRESQAQSTDGDNAEISSFAHALKPQDSQRLEQLSLDVQSGQYRVSGEKVAKAIVDEALAASS